MTELVRVLTRFLEDQERKHEESCDESQRGCELGTLLDSGMCRLPAGKEYWLRKYGKLGLGAEEFLSWSEAMYFLRYVVAEEDMKMSKKRAVGRFCGEAGGARLRLRGEGRAVVVEKDKVMNFRVCPGEVVDVEVGGKGFVRWMSGDVRVSGMLDGVRVSEVRGGVEYEVH